jgi:hypothetical protein
MRRNTDAPVSGGATGMSIEVPVMGMEQSGGIVWSKSQANSATRMSL